MPRDLRVNFPGAIYHVTSRGNNGRLIFVDDRDREQFLYRLAGVARALEWKCRAFCLMSNHYHLFVETPKGDLPEGMLRLNGPYARAFNKRHGRRGHLFENRYHAALIQDESHFLEVCRYIVLNPVRAGLCETPDEWRWSSYLATVGATRTPAYLDLDWLPPTFGAVLETARARYVEFVADAAPTSSLEAILAA